MHNGLAEAEFAPVAPLPEASDVLFIGELRALKGVHVLIEAIALLAAGGRRARAMIVGAGPDRDALVALAQARGVAALVAFADPLPAREAFCRGRLLVVPSLAESLPYIVLEGAAAGLPMLATAVGGLPEICAPQRGRLLPAGDAAALAAGIATALDDPGKQRTAADDLRARVRADFSLDFMVEQVLAAYAAALACRGRGRKMPPDERVP